MDPMLKALFVNAVLPAIKQLDTPALSELREFLIEQIDAEIANRGETVN